MSESTLIFSPIRIRSLELKNRLVLSPMCQYSAQEGLANDWHLVHYGSRAAGGMSLILQEATAVAPEGRITPLDLGLYNDVQMEQLKVVTAFIRQQGCIPGIQLAHAGRKAGCAAPWLGGKQLSPEQGGWETLSASAIPFFADDRPPLAMDLPAIQRIVEHFREAAIRAKQAGYQVVEIHAAHGYLLHQFLSPHANKRTDAYGGSFANRCRFMLEVTDAVRGVWPDELPLFVRLSATDWKEEGWDAGQTVQLAGLLKERGVDLIDTSTGGLLPDVAIPVGPGFQVPFAARIKREAGLATGTVGWITEAQQAEEILRNGEADLILLGRPALSNPHLPLAWADELGASTEWPVQYIRGKRCK